MNFNIFVLISTIIYYIVLRIYKSNIIRESSNSNFIFVLYVPIVLYICYYFFTCKNEINEKIIDSISSSFPESSFMSS